MTDPDEERQKIERDMWRVVWVLLPIAVFIFLLWLNWLTGPESSLPSIRNIWGK
jgi:hypothetical protein